MAITEQFGEIIHETNRVYSLVGPFRLSAPLAKEGPRTPSGESQSAFRQRPDHFRPHDIHQKFGGQLVGPVVEGTDKKKPVTGPGALVSGATGVPLVGLLLGLVFWLLSSAAMVNQYVVPLVTPVTVRLRAEIGLVVTCVHGPDLDVAW